mmetsp:Transcript_11706/g.15177  ORF Transcript_11706/g.15177 Transcript_11706/m.15177 type:complete len:179 (-) Transcript_11706:69-605(-)
MLAPRKKLWSTPKAVINSAIQIAQIKKDDVVYDIGCGDGRFLVQCALQTGAQSIGVEIEESRIQEARKCIADEGVEDLVHVYQGNALDMNYESATVVFLYLIPRGLRKILPILQKIPHPIRVVTYMSPFEGMEPTETLKLTPEHQKEAEWPLFLYHLNTERKPVHQKAGECCTLCLIS